MVLDCPAAAGTRSILARAGRIGRGCALRHGPPSPLPEAVLEQQLQVVSSGSNIRLSRVCASLGSAPASQQPAGTGASGCGGWRRGRLAVADAPVSAVNGGQRCQR